MALTWKDRIKVAVASGGTGTLTLGSAASGYQTFAAGDDGKLFPYVIENGTAWETGYGTYTHSGTTFARTSRTDSSSGSAIDAGTGNLYVDLVSNNADNMNLAAQAITPGGRLTLESGVPVSTTDQTAKTTIYYTPYLHNIINLWDGNVWKAITFAETTEALGTLTSGLPYDVFGFLSSGVLDLEKLAWTNGTTRATAITLQDGRYCKSGDKTRLYLGTFYTTATTTTEDSIAKRFVWNMYNRVNKLLRRFETTNTWTYTSTTKRQANASSANQVECVVGAPDAAIFLLLQCSATNDTGTPYFSACIGEDSTTTYSTDAINYQGGGNTTTLCAMASSLTKHPAIGYHYYSWLEAGAGSGTTTFYSFNSGVRQGGIQGFIHG